MLYREFVGMIRLLVRLMAYGRKAVSFSDLRRASLSGSLLSVSRRLVRHGEGMALMPCETPRRAPTAAAFVSVAPPERMVLRSAETKGVLCQK